MLAVAKAESHPLLGDLAAGSIHVDQVPASAMPGGVAHNADYVSTAQDTGHKGDTIYLPTGLDITNAYQRSVVVHELRHAVDDKAAGGGKVQFQDKARLELEGYRAQGASLMSQLRDASTAARTAIARQIGAEWGDMVLLGMLLASRADRATADPLITLVNTEAPTGRQLPPALLDPPPGWERSQARGSAIRAIQAAYSLPAGRWPRWTASPERASWTGSAVLTTAAGRGPMLLPPPRTRGSADEDHRRTGSGFVARTELRHARY